MATSAGTFRIVELEPSRTSRTSRGPARSCGRAGVIRNCSWAVLPRGDQWTTATLPHPAHPRGYITVGGQDGETVFVDRVGNHTGPPTRGVFTLDCSRVVWEDSTVWCRGGVGAGTDAGMSAACAVAPPEGYPDPLGIKKVYLLFSNHLDVVSYQLLRFAVHSSHGDAGGFLRGTR